MRPTVQHRQQPILTRCCFQNMKHGLGFWVWGVRFMIDLDAVAHNLPYSKPFLTLKAPIASPTKISAHLWLNACLKPQTPGG